MAFLDQNDGLTPLENCQFFDSFNFLFYSLYRRFFFSEYCKRHIPDLYCLKRNVGSIAIFGP